jgi:hypothetical protein
LLCLRRQYAASPRQFQRLDGQVFRVHRNNPLVSG